MDDVPDVGDEADSPIIVPRPNQILRRAARTKIRKPNLQGDGGGHRFPSTRRGGQRAQTIATSDGSEQDHDDIISLRQQLPTTESQDDRPVSYTDEVFIFDAYAERRDSLTSSESHERSEEDSREQRLSSSPPPSLPPVSQSTLPLLELPPQTSHSLPPALFEPTPQQTIPAVKSDVAFPSRTPSPPISESGLTEVAAQSPTTPYAPPLPSEALSMRREEPPPVQVRPHPAPSSSPSPSPSRKEKEKKGGLFGKWGAKEDKKKVSKGESVREKELRDREKDSGFFGSLFGGKKKHEDSPASPGLLHGSSGPATAAALLGASKSSKSYITLPSPQLAGAYARYPIHVERAVYRLSHIKLANPRRPLYEQVLISNLMFWYLGVINKAQNGGTGVGAGVAPGTQGPAQPQGQAYEVVQPDKEAQEREQRERAEMERLERERERAEQSKRESGRKGSLTKAPKAGGEGVGSRRAEMPVRGPQYESQHRAIEQEYGYVGSPNQGTSTSPPVRAGSAPPSTMAGSSGYHQYNNHRMSPAPMMQARSGSPPQAMQQGRSRSPPGQRAAQQGRSGSPPIQHSTQQGRSASPPSHHMMQPGMQQGQYYYNHAIESQGHNQIPHPSISYSLPPGAMMPLSMDQSWFSSPGGAQSVSPPSSPLDSQTYNFPAGPSGQQQQPHAAPPPRRQRSPPPTHLATPGHPKHPTATPPGARLQGRSLSATAVLPQTQQQASNGRLKKKHSSAMAAPPQRRQSDSGGTFGEEDLPLAVWQQQQRASGRR